MARKIRQPHPLAVGFGLVFLLSLTLADRARAGTFNVITLADSGPGSLRQVVLNANAAAGADTIVFSVDGTITLTSGEIVITDDLVINGPGAGALTVSGNDQSRIFHVNDDTAGAIDVTLSGLTLTRGHAQGSGGAVLTYENLTILDSVISYSVAESLSAALGGNVAQANGTLHIENSSLIGGVATGPGDDRGGNLFGGTLVEHSLILGGSADIGGGIYLSGRIHASTVSGNTAYLGGGIYGSPAIDSSTISGNTASGFGGGVSFFLGGSILNSTISGNKAYYGGGIELDSIGDGTPDTFIPIRLTTIANNTATSQGGGIYFRFIDQNAVELDHSILANGSPEDLPSSFSEANYSLIEKSEGFIIFGSHNILGVDPLLGPLVNNGGPTLTHALLPGSPAIDAGNPAIQDPPATDQRGFARIYGPAIDLGAVETQPLDIVDIPTLSEVGMLLLSLLVLAAGVWRLRMEARRATA